MLTMLKIKVDAVTDTAKKGDFNNRINAVVSAIETKEDRGSGSS